MLFHMVTSDIKSSYGLAKREVYIYLGPVKVRHKDNKRKVAITQEIIHISEIEH